MPAGAARKKTARSAKSNLPFPLCSVLSMGGIRRRSYGKLRRMGIGRTARRRLAIVLGDLLGEAPEIAGPVADYFDLYLRRMPRWSALGLRAVVFAIVWAPVLFVGVPADE